MSLFEPIQLTWKGKPYNIPAKSVMRAIVKVEEVITLQRLSVDPQDIPVARISMAYGALLRFAGAPVQDEEVYEAMMGGAEDGGAPVQMVQALLLMMLPKRVRDKLEADAKAQQNAEAQEMGGPVGNEDAATTTRAS